MQGIDVQRLKTVLTQTYPLAKPYIESAGPQISTAWRILPSSIYAGGVIAVTEGKPGFGADGFASIGYQSPEAQERQRQADAAAAARKKP